MKFRSGCFIAILFLFSCSKTDEGLEPNHLVNSNEFLTDVIIQDIFTPPVASRIYAYSNLAAYECLAVFTDSIRTLDETLNQFDIQLAPPQEQVDPGIASFIAFHKVAREIVFSYSMVDDRIDSMINVYNKYYTEDIVNHSIGFGEKVAKIIVDYSKADGYHQRTGYTRYSNNKEELGRWTATPPDYMEGIEPNWNTLRPFLLDSANQFAPPPPTSFSIDPKSQFYKEAHDVYSAVENIDEEQKAIAKFWDCNPNISYRKGHMMFYHQKLSPGGHWIGITNLIIDEKRSGIYSSAKALTFVSLSLFDAFLSCWDEKYRSSLIRPITYINKYIDKEWNSILQTPAFPEYTSGHSVISAAAAVTLTNVYGDNIQFVDTTEEPYGLPARKFSSFMAASQEAAISRFYGGIHYMPAIENGVEQGINVAEFALNKLSEK